MSNVTNARKGARKYLHNGESLTVAQWAEKTGVSRANIQNRMACGRSLADAIRMGASRPRATGGELFDAFGESLTLAQWADRYSLPMATLRQRLKRHSLEDSLEFVAQRGRTKCASKREDAALLRKREVMALKLVEALSEKGEATCMAILKRIDSHL